MDQKSTDAPGRRSWLQPGAHTNRLLDAFEPTSRARIDPHIQPVNLVLGDVVCEAGGFLKYVYFPRGSVLSLLTVLANGAAIETANIGNEGAFGLFAAMYSRTSFNQCLVQLQGGLVRVPVEILRTEFDRSDHVRNLLVCYSETQLAQVQQTAACNAMHTIQQKLCRWLLMMHDRTEFRRAVVHARIFGLHVGGRPEIGDACRASDAGRRSHRLPSGEDTNRRSSRA